MRSEPPSSLPSGLSGNSCGTEGHAWASHHRPGHLVYWVRTCMLCEEIDWDDLDKEIRKIMSTPDVMPVPGEGGPAADFAATGEHFSVVRTNADGTPAPLPADHPDYVPYSHDVQLPDPPAAPPAVATPDAGGASTGPSADPTGTPPAHPGEDAPSAGEAAAIISGDAVPDPTSHPSGPGDPDTTTATGSAGSGGKSEPAHAQPETALVRLEHVVGAITTFAAEHPGLDRIFVTGLLNAIRAIEAV